MSVKVTVYTGTGSSREINTNATKWSQLRDELLGEGINFTPSSTKAVIGETENTLESNDAAIPTTDFTLFLLPQKVKSGFEDSYEDGYEDSYDDEEEQPAPSQPASVNPSNWTKQDALDAIQVAVNKLNEVRTYVQNQQTNPLDQRAQELMKKLIG